MALIAEHEEYLKLIDKTNAELYDSFKKMNSKAKKDEIDSFVEEYEKNTKKIEVYKFIAEQKRDELNIVQKSVVSIKEKVKENLEDKSTYLSAFGKVLCAKAGVTLAKAVKDELDGKAVDYGTLGSNLAKETGEALLAGVATAFLGPIGGSMVNMGFSMLFPEPPKPDPYLERFSKIDAALESGFKSIKDEIYKMDAKIDQRFYKWSNYVVEKTTFLIEEKTKINNAFLSIEKDLIYVDSIYNSIFVKRNNHIDESRILDINEGIKSKIIGLIDSFYSEKFSTETYTYKIIQFYRYKDPKFRPFTHTIDELLIYCHKIQALVELYFLKLKKIKKCLSVIYTNHTLKNKNDNKEDYFAALFDICRDEFDEKSNLFSKVYFLHNLAIGANNIFLYKNISSYYDTNKLNVDFNFLNGFGLVNPNNKSEQLAISFSDTKPTASPFSFIAKKDYIHRYVIGKKDRELPDGDFKMHLLTMQNNEYLIPVPVYIALGYGDTLILFDESFSLSVNVKVVTFEDAIFDGTIEKQLLHSGELVIPLEKVIRFSLPTPNYILNVCRSNKNERRVSYLNIWISHKNDDAIIEYIIPYNTYLNNSSRMAIGNFNDLGYGFQEARENTSGGVSNYTIIFLSNGYKQKTESINPLLSRLGVYNSDVYSNCFSGSSLNNITFFSTVNLRGPNTTSHILHSLNRKYYLKIDDYSEVHKELNIYYHDSQNNTETKLGSVFQSYNFTPYNPRYHFEFQKDGNLVMYNAVEKAIAATDTSDCNNTYLHLTNEGELLLRRISNFELVKKIVVPKHDVTYKNTQTIKLFNGLGNGEKLKLDEVRYSENGKYTLKLSIEGRRDPGFLREYQYRYSLILFKTSESSKTKIIFNHDAYTHKQEDARNIYFTIGKNGNLVLFFEKVDLLNNVNTNVVHELKINAQNAYLELTNNGVVNIMSADGKTVVHELGRI
jgi:hypothetical protein